MVRSRRARLAGWVFVALVAGAPPAFGQDPPPTVLSPGETRPNIPAAGKVLQVQGNLFADFRSWAAVWFERADAQAQNIKLEARHPVRLFAVYGKAIARGMLFLDFCVPARDAVSGCGAESETADMINATLNFGYGIVGRVAAQGPTSEATLAVTASVLDRVEQRYVHVQDLKNLSASEYSLPLIDTLLLPVSVPGIEDATISRGVTFSLLLRRGRVYRFQLAAAATSTKGPVQPLAPGGFFALADFAGPVPGLLAPLNGFVQLRNLTISVSPDVPTLQELLQSLQEQVAALFGQIDQLRSDHQADLETLRAELADLRLSTMGPDAGVCMGAAPGTDWVCAGGAWVPPGHPLAGGAVPPPPPASPPSSACPGAAPATGWVCVKGGWVPPDHPLARGSG